MRNDCCLCLSGRLNKLVENVSVGVNFQMLYIQARCCKQGRYISAVTILMRPVLYNDNGMCSEI